jgi:hypothetical protein
MAFLAISLAVAAPASRWMARLVEKRNDTFTVAGATFVGLLFFPVAVLLTNATAGSLLETTLPTLPVLAAAAVAYALGEGLGRLACISFGCCYGKPLDAAPAPLRRLFRRCCFVFSGATKKVAYEGGLEGVPVLPVQALTATLLTAVALAGMLLFLRDRFVASAVLCLGATQGWRLVSETLRADDRGGGRLTAYQGMAALGLLCAVALPLLVPPAANRAADLAVGLRSLWDPAALLFVQLVWALVFLTMGRSVVTESTLMLRVRGRSTASAAERPPDARVA